MFLHFPKSSRARAVCQVLSLARLAQRSLPSNRLLGTRITCCRASGPYSPPVQTKPCRIPNLSPGPIYLTLESYLISKQALHIWVIYRLALSSAPCASPPSSSVIWRTCTRFFEIQTECSLGPELVALSSALSYYSVNSIPC